MKAYLWLGMERGSSSSHWRLQRRTAKVVHMKFEVQCVLPNPLGYSTHILSYVQCCSKGSLQRNGSLGVLEEGSDPSHLKSNGLTKVHVHVTRSHFQQIGHPSHYEDSLWGNACFIYLKSKNERSLHKGKGVTFNKTILPERNQLLARLHLLPWFTKSLWPFSRNKTAAVSTPGGQGGVPENPRALFPQTNIAFSTPVGI